MQFINIVVHSVEDMNFRVHLQFDFTKLGLDDYLDVSLYHSHRFFRKNLLEVTDPFICSEENCYSCCSLCSEHRNLPYHPAAISVFAFQKLKHTESDKLQVQIQAYLDNVFDVGALLEDAETKNAALERVEELEENLSHVSV